MIPRQDAIFFRVIRLGWIDQNTSATRHMHLMLINFLTILAEAVEQQHCNYAKLFVAHSGLTAY
ncbi:hypothetical protein SAMN05216411_1223 [Nitrosospira multiformis]|nr:hypothetical protein SAMN05216411_1223 [Nitrosospira multiformis]